MLLIFQAFFEKQKKKPLTTTKPTPQYDYNWETEYKI